MDEDIIAMLLTALLVFIPVAGLTLRFALKPMVDSIARLMEVRARSEEGGLLERRIALLEQEVRTLRGERRGLEEQFTASQLQRPPL